MAMHFKKSIVMCVLAQPAFAQNVVPIHGAELQRYWAQKYVQTFEQDLYTDFDRPVILVDGLSFKLERDFSGKKIERVTVETESDRKAQEER
jgi:hypothetical protein